MHKIVFFFFLYLTLQLATAEALTLTVSSADALKKAIASSRTILIAPGTYDLGQGLNINNVTHLTIKATADAPTDSVILMSSGRSVVSITNANNIRMGNLSLVLESKKDNSDIFVAKRSETLFLTKLSMTGNAAVGLHLERVRSLHLDQSTLKECAGMALNFLKCEAIIVSNTVLKKTNKRDKDASIRLRFCDDIMLKKTQFDALGAKQLFDVAFVSNVYLDACEFINNRQRTFFKEKKRVETELKRFYPQIPVLGNDIHLSHNQFQNNAFGTIEDTPAEVYCYASSGLIIRDQPSLEGSKLGKIPYLKHATLLNAGSKIERIGPYSGQWQYVQFGTIKGYVFDTWASRGQLALQIERGPESPQRVKEDASWQHMILSARMTQKPRVGTNVTMVPLNRMYAPFHLEITDTYLNENDVDTSYWHVGLELFRNTAYLNKIEGDAYPLFQTLVFYPQQPHAKTLPITNENVAISAAFQQVKEVITQSCELKDVVAIVDFDHDQLPDFFYLIVPVDVIGPLEFCVIKKEGAWTLYSRSFPQ